MTFLCCIFFIFHGYGRPKFNFDVELLTKLLFICSFPNRKMCKIFLVAMKAFQYKPTLFNKGEKDERKKQKQKQKNKEVHVNIVEVFVSCRNTLIPSCKYVVPFPYSMRRKHVHTFHSFIFYCFSF